MARKSGLQQYPLDGFPYGLNTAVEESILDPKYSPSMLNVFVSDTNAIVRRRGFELGPKLPDGVAGTALKSIYKFYNSDESWYWLFVAGTHIYAHLETNATGEAVNVPPTLKQFYKTNVTASYMEEIYSHSYSQDNAIQLSAPCILSATVPECTRFTLRVPSVVASLQIDDDPWQSLSGTGDADEAIGTYVIGVTPGAHTIKLKQSNDIGNCLRLNTATPSSTTRAYAMASMKDIPEIKKSIEVAFYDTKVNGSSAYVNFRNARGTFTVGLKTNESPYYMLKDYSGKVRAGYATRNTGWHTIKYMRDTGEVLIDGWSLGVVPYSPFTAIELVSYAAADKGAHANYFDTLLVDGKVHDGFDADIADRWNVTYGGGDGSFAVYNKLDSVRIRRGRNTKSLRVVTAAPSSSTRTIAKANSGILSSLFSPGIVSLDPTSFGDPIPMKYVTISFYDWDSDNTSSYVQFNTENETFYAGLRLAKNTNYYTVSNDDGTVCTSNTVRSTGWHTVTMVFAGNGFYDKPYAFYFDDEYAGNWQYLEGSTPVLESISLTSYTNAGAGSGHSSYFDEIIINDELFEDFESTSGWELESIGPGTGSMSVSDVHYTTGDIRKPLVVDFLVYRFDTTPTVIDTISATAENISFIAIDKCAYYGTEFDTIRKFDGLTSASITTTTDAPKAGFLVENKGRAFASGDSADPTLVTFSGITTGATGTAEDWTVANGAGVARLVARQSDAPCTGLAVLNKVLYYFSYSRVAALDTTGDASTDWYVKDISMTHGCISPKTIAVGDRGVIFLSADGVRAVGPVQSIFANDGTGLSLMSKNVVALNSELTVSPGNPQYDKTQVGYTAEERSKAVGAYFENSYWLFIGEDCYIADLTKQTENKQPVWSRHKFGIKVTCAFTTRGDDYGLFVGTDDGNVYKMNVGYSDNGQPYPWHYETPLVGVGGYSTNKHFRTAYVGARLVFPYDANTPGEERITDSAEYRQEFFMITSTDQPSKPFHTHKMFANPYTDLKPIRQPISTIGRALKLRFEGNSSKEPISIPYVLIQYGSPNIGR